MHVRKSIVDALAALFVAPIVAGQEEAEKLAWLREHVAVVSSLEPDHTSVTDLAPLTRELEGVRIVLLGETAHGAGEALKAKVRLVKFLHEHLGFRVLVWESGLVGCHRVDELLRTDMQPLEAAFVGIYGVWSTAREVAPLFEHAQRSHRTAEPLHMAGFDCQANLTSGPHGLSTRLGGYLERLPEAVEVERGLALLRQAWELCGEVFGAAYQACYGVDRRKLSDEEFAAQVRERLPADDAVAAAYAALQALRDQFQAPEMRACLDRRTLGFVDRALENVAAEIDRQLEQARRSIGLGSGGPARDEWNLRDAQNARNLLWLADDYYRDHKLIVWAHNVHLMNAFLTDQMRSVTTEPSSYFTPMGVHVKRLLGEEVYTLLFTAYQGETSDGGPDMQPRYNRRIGPAPEASLEARLHALGAEQAFLDLRSAAKDPDHWLRKPFQMGLRAGYFESMEDWTRAMDGIFFVDRGFVSTPVEKRH